MNPEKKRKIIPIQERLKISIENLDPSIQIEVRRLIDVHNSLSKELKFTFEELKKADLKQQLEATEFSLRQFLLS